MAMMVPLKLMILILNQLIPFVYQLFATCTHKKERQALDKKKAHQNYPNSITDLRKFFTFNLFDLGVTVAATGTLGFCICEQGNTG